MYCLKCRAKLDLQTHLDTKMLKSVKLHRFSIKQVFWIVVVAVIIFLLTLMLYPDSMNAATIGRDDYSTACKKLRILQSIPSRKVQTLTEGEINAYMEASVARAGKTDKSSIVPARIRKIRLSLSRNIMTVQVARTLGPFALGPIKLGSLDSTYRLSGVPVAARDGFEFRVLSGARGQLPLPGFCCGSCVSELERFFSELEREKTFLDDVETFEIDNGMLSVRMKSSR
jgi:hypothetical protein